MINIHTATWTRRCLHTTLYSWVASSGVFIGGERWRHGTAGMPCRSPCLCIHPQGKYNRNIMVTGPGMTLKSHRNHISDIGIVITKLWKIHCCMLKRASRWNYICCNNLTDGLSESCINESIEFDQILQNSIKLDCLYQYNIFLSQYYSLDTASAHRCLSILFWIKNKNIATRIIYVS